MGAHSKHKVHDNSVKSYGELLSGLAERQSVILSVIDSLNQEGNYPSDRSILIHAALDDMNQVRPRVTELIKLGLVREHGTTKDAITGKTVRTLEIVKEENFVRPNNLL